MSHSSKAPLDTHHRHNPSAIPQTSTESSQRKRKSSPLNESEPTREQKRKSEHSESKDEVATKTKLGKHTSTAMKQNSAPIKSSSKVTDRPKMTVANVFGGDSSDDDEEMPFEAKLRLKNMGKNTPTSTGPNSFGKVTGKGFIDPRVQWKKVIEDAKKKTDEEEDKYKSQIRSTSNS